MELDCVLSSSSPSTSWSVSTPRQRFFEKMWSSYEERSIGLSDILCRSNFKLAFTVCRVQDVGCSNEFPNHRLNSYTYTVFRYQFWKCDASLLLIRHLLWKSGRSKRQNQLNFSKIISGEAVVNNKLVTHERLVIQWSRRSYIQYEYIRTNIVHAELVYDGPNWLTRIYSQKTTVTMVSVATPTSSFSNMFIFVS